MHFNDFYFSKVGANAWRRTIRQASANIDTDTRKHQIHLENAQNIMAAMTLIVGVSLLALWILG